VYVVCMYRVCSMYMSKSTGVYLVPGTGDVCTHTHVPGTQVLFLEKTKTKTLKFKKLKLQVVHTTCKTLENCSCLDQVAATCATTFSPVSTCTYKQSPF
jgi:hypothetical protein